MFFLVSLMWFKVGVVLIFCVVWLGFLLGFLGDFIGNLQRDVCVLFGLNFCTFFGFLLVLKDIFFVHFL